MLRARMIISVLVFFLISFVSFLMVHFNPRVDHTFYFLLNVIALAVIPPLYQLFTKSLRKDLYDGTMNLVEWKVTDKLAYEDDDPGIGSNGWTSAYNKYLFKSNGYRFRVSKELYEKTEVGDVFLVPTTPYSGYEFEPVKHK